MTLLDGIVLSGFLATAFQWRGVLSVDIRLVYVVAVAVLCYTTWLDGLRVRRQIAVFLVAVGATSLLGVLAGRTTVPLVAGQLAGIGVFSTALFAYFRLNRDQLLSKVRWYFDLMFYLAILAILQEVAYLVGFRPLYDVNYLLPGVGVGELTREGPFLRVFSFFTEPGHFAIALTPAVYVAINGLFFGKRFFYTRLQAVTVLVALVLTFSSVGYAGLLLSVFAAAGRRRAVRAAVLLGTVGGSAFVLVSGFRYRLVTLFELLARGDTPDVYVSSFDFYLNARAALASFLAHPLWGSGLRSHSVSYDRYVTQTGLSESVVQFLRSMKPEDLNRVDAYSMLLRIPSELGLLGILSVTYFFLSNRVKVDAEPYRMLGTMCAVFFITYCVRDGNYFRFELWYFLALYAYLQQAALHAASAIPGLLRVPALALTESQ